MNKYYAVLTLLGAGISLIAILKSNAPPVILDRYSEIEILKGYDGYNCDFGSFRYSTNSTCLAGVNPAYRTLDAVENFYLAQMKTLNWIKLSNSLYKKPTPRTGTHFFARTASSECQMEIALTVTQNMYRGGVKLDDISVRFEEYPVNCATLDLTSR